MILQKRFAQRVREAMEIEGINQTELGLRMGVTRSLVSQYLTGVRSPGLDMLERFAKALSVDEPSLLIGSEEICPADA